jgi:CBS domain-containing protein/tetratricopeptide (TPR) repeat protein
MAIPQHTLILDVAKSMALFKSTAFVVTLTNGHVIGIVSEQDLVRKIVAVEKDINKLTVGEIMSVNPICVENTGKPAVDDASALQLMLKGNFRHVPIVTFDGNIKKYDRSVDIMTAVSATIKKRPNLLHHIGNVARRFVRMTSSNNNNQLSRSSVMVDYNNPLVELPAGATVLETAKFMLTNRLSAVLVSSKYGTTGICTESDIVRRVLGAGLSPATTTLADIMTPNPFSLSLDDMNPQIALETMLKKGFRHLPIKSNNGNLIMILDVLSCVRTALGMHEERQRPVSSLLFNTGNSSSSSSSALLAPPALPFLPLLSPASVNTVSSSSLTGENSTTTIPKNEVLTSEPIVIIPEACEVVVMPQQPTTTTNNTIPVTTTTTTTITQELETLKQECGKKLARSDFASALLDLNKAETLVLNTITSTDASKSLITDRDRIRQRRGMVKSVLGNSTGALQDFELVITHCNESRIRDEARISTIEILIELERFEQINPHLVSIEDENMRNDVITSMLLPDRNRLKECGKTCFKSEEFLDAVRFFTSALRVHKAINNSKFEVEEEEAILYCNRGACYQSLKQYEMALEDCWSAIRLKQNYDKAWVRLCQVLESLNRQDDRLSAAEAGLKVIQNKQDERLIKHRQEAMELIEGGRENNNVVGN